MLALETMLNDIEWDGYLGQQVSFSSDTQPLMLSTSCSRIKTLNEHGQGAIKLQADLI